MRPRDLQLANNLRRRLTAFDANVRGLPGIRAPERQTVLIEQILESLHRVQYVHRLLERSISSRRADPNDELFDPLKAAILYMRNGEREEAFWLVFLFVHFGKHARAGWRYTREVYGRLGQGGLWSWAAVSTDPGAFRDWLDEHKDEIQREGVPRGFGNHRKYETLDARSPNGTGEAVETYVSWVAPPRTHAQLFDSALATTDGNPTVAFDVLYESMSSVARFGRTAKFDYLTMVGKLGLSAIEPGSTYMQGATGPVTGAKLLFGSGESAAILDRWVSDLGAYTGLGMQVLEDSLCNWQKSPDEFIRFRG